MTMVHVATCSPRARLGSFDGLDHVSRAPTTAQDAHFHRWMPMAMVPPQHQESYVLDHVRLSYRRSTTDFHVPEIDRRGAT